jgi:deazaflavin-dependent oxidoreductase (nitroreductase family)
VAQVPRSVARFNKRVTNPIQLSWAPYLPPWAVIDHVGRRSGRRYATPVIGSVHDGTLYVAVLYGERSDWVRNVLAAEGGHVRRAGRSFRLGEPRIHDADHAPGLAGHLLGRVSGRVLCGELTPE